jgi:hypothetical protein
VAVTGLVVPGVKDGRLPAMLLKSRKTTLCRPELVSCMVKITCAGGPGVLLERTHEGVEVAAPADKARHTPSEIRRT